MIAQKMLGDDNLLILSGTFDGLTLPDLSQFEALMGGDDLLKSLVPQGAVPPFFVQGSSLSIQSASLTVTCSPFSVNSASLVVGLDDSVWSPLNGIDIYDLEALFAVDNPFNAQRSLQAAIYGSMSIGDISLDMGASAPNFTVKALWEYGDPVTLQAVPSTASPALNEIGNLTVDALYFEVQPTTGFTLSAALADEPQPWTLELGPEQLSLRNMRLLLNYAKGSGFSGSLSGLLALAGAQLDVSC